VTPPLVALTMPQMMLISVGLAGAVRAEQRENLAVAYLQVDVFKRLEAGGVGFVKMRDGNGGRHDTFLVIPGRRKAASPESIFTDGGYGFRVPRCARPRNDGTVSHQGRAALDLPFEALDLIALDHGQADVVEAV